MHYEEPKQNDSFELPEEWIAEAGLKSFKPASESFDVEPNKNHPVTEVLISDVLAPKRNPGVKGLDHARSVSILIAKDVLDSSRKRAEWSKTWKDAEPNILAKTRDSLPTRCPADH